MFDFLKKFFKKDENYISIAAIAKNEAPYIKEWIEYHRLIGVEKFYIYDNNSKDNLKETLKPYIKEKIVKYHKKNGKRQQLRAYEHALRHYKNKTRWLAVIDLDEFILPINTDSLAEILKDYEQYPALCINWLMFDSNGHKTKPKGLVIKNYTRIQGDWKENFVNKHVKSIVNPKKVLKFKGPHCCIYKNNEIAVNELFEKTEGAFTKIHSSEKIRLNHYYSKSEEEYKLKTSRGNADSKQKRTFEKSLLWFPPPIASIMLY